MSAAARPPARRDATIRVFGIRHHGPGSARSLLRALKALDPEVVLVEGPADASGALPLASAKGMRPPLGLVVYPPDQPGRGMVYPFAAFSPEWNALRFALRRRIAVRFCDLPLGVGLALAPPAADEADGASEPAAPGVTAASDGANKPSAPPPAAAPAPERSDPLRLLAEAAGETDPERWWERLVEQRRDDTDLFEAVAEAMAAIREDAPDRDPFDAYREAHMRLAIRQARREGFQRIAVVCGAWHAPALAVDAYPAAADEAMLRGVKPVRTEATWVPWTHERLARASGYGAGVESPAWYAHLWATDGDLVAWFAAAARLLRAADLGASPAEVVEAVRLAETLAALRDRPKPGLGEVRDATLAALCSGEEARFHLVERHLVIGNETGAVARGVPSVPLQRDLEAQARRLRLKLEPRLTTLELDLRQTLHLERSRLLRRLGLLGIEWGRRIALTVQAQGTFHERWVLAWQPAMLVHLVVQGAYGNTVAAAAAARVQEQAEQTEALPALAGLVGEALRAGLEDVVPSLVARIEERSAGSTDVVQMLQALPPLAEARRYGDVRRTRGEPLAVVARAVAERAMAGLGPACAGVDDDTAQTLVGCLEGATRALALLEDAALTEAWWAALARLADRPSLHGLLGGTCCRLLLGANRLSDTAAGERLAFHLSPGADPPDAARWFEGFLRQSGLRLATSDGLFALVDQWLTGLRPDHFLALLPLLRRTCATFQPGERRQVAERAGVQAGAASPLWGGDADAALDPERVALVEPVVLRLLGVER